jgi:hypothetical protein
MYLLAEDKSNAGKCIEMSKKVADISHSGISDECTILNACDMRYIYSEKLRLMLVSEVRCLREWVTDLIPSSVIF